MLTASPDSDTGNQYQQPVMRGNRRYRRVTPIGIGLNTLYNSAFTRAAVWQLFAVIAHQAVDWDTVGQPRTTVQKTEFHNESKAT